MQKVPFRVCVRVSWVWVDKHEWETVPDLSVNHHIQLCTQLSLFPSSSYHLHRSFYWCDAVRSTKSASKMISFVIVLVKFTLIVLALALLKLSILKFDAAYYYSIAWYARAHFLSTYPNYFILMLRCCVLVSLDIRAVPFRIGATISLIRHSITYILNFIELMKEWDLHLHLFFSFFSQHQFLQ